MTKNDTFAKNSSDLSVRGGAWTLEFKSDEFVKCIILV